MGCTLLITWPPPDALELAGLYEQEGYYEARGGLDEAARVAWLNRASGILEATDINPRSALDFGAGVGHLVHALRVMGIDADGVETSSAARMVARRVYGLELRSELPLNAGREFELVTLIHSLEHVVDPVGTLKEITGLLRSEGRLFIEVPHAGSIEMWHPRLRRQILDLPHHLYHFEPVTLRRVVQCAGLRVVEIRLSNPVIIEWALGLRTRWKRTVVRSFVENTEGLPNNASVQVESRSFWAQRLLPWVRSRFPGGKLQVVATRAS
jgi:SAM-dependent methyltransferase